MSGFRKFCESVLVCVFFFSSIPCWPSALLSIECFLSHAHFACLALCGGAVNRASRQGLLKQVSLLDTEHLYLSDLRLHFEAQRGFS